jgi:hypothetical protein
MGYAIQLSAPLSSHKGVMLVTANYLDNYRTGIGYEDEANYYATTVVRLPDN